MQDSYIPVKGLARSQIELLGKQLKTVTMGKDFSGSVVTTISKLPSQNFIKKDSQQKFEIKSTAYCKDKKIYVQIMKFDLEKLQYECRAMKDEKKDSSNLIIDQKDLST